jgi:hypothetical protein
MAFCQYVEREKMKKTENIMNAAVDLYKRHSKRELLEMQKGIRETRRNNVFLYKKSVEQNLDAINLAIKWKTQDEPFL